MTMRPMSQGVRTWLMIPRGPGQRQYTHALRRGLWTRGSAAVPIPSRRITQKGVGRLSLSNSASLPAFMEKSLDA